MATVPFHQPSNTDDLAQWQELLAQYRRQNVDPAAISRYLAQSLNRSERLRRDAQKLCAAVCLLRRDTFPETAPLYSCDHVFHTVCMPYVDNKGVCPVCGVTFHPPTLDETDPQIQQRVLHQLTQMLARDIVDPKQDLATAVETALTNRRLDPTIRALMSPAEISINDLIKQHPRVDKQRLRITAHEVLAEGRAAVRRVAQRVQQALIPSLTGPTLPFPTLVATGAPSDKRRARDSTDTSSRSKCPRTNAAGAGGAGAPPLDMQLYDVLPTLPLGAFAKRLECHGVVHSVFATQYDGRCKACGRTTVRDRTFLVRHPNGGYPCTLCTLQLTSDAVYKRLCYKPAASNPVTGEATHNHEVVVDAQADKSSENVDNMFG